MLARLGIPLLPHGEAVSGMLAKLPAATQSMLREAGMIEYEEFDAGRGMERRVRPTWSARVTYYWKQTFPAGREIAIEHNYTPSVGGSAQTFIGSTYATKQDMTDYMRRYCIDAGFIRAVKKLQGSGSGGKNIVQQFIGFVLVNL